MTGHHYQFAGLPLGFQFAQTVERVRVHCGDGHCGAHDELQLFAILESNRGLRSGELRGALHAHDDEAVRATLYGRLLALQRNKRAIVQAVEDIGHVWFWRLLACLRRNGRATSSDQAKHQDCLLKCAHGHSVADSGERGKGALYNLEAGDRLKRWIKISADHPRGLTLPF